MSLRKYIRRNMYRWHRVSSLIIAIPVLLWAISGFMHPLMTNIRPQVATQRLTAPVIDTSKLKVSLADALQKNKVATFRSFRLVAINDNWFYQVKVPGTNVLQYYSTDRGKRLPDGDELYARYLAKQFLEGEEGKIASGDGHDSDSTKAPSAVGHIGKGKPPVMLAALKLEPLAAGSSTPAAEAIAGEHDCCTNTMASVMNVTKGAKVSEVAFIEQFNGEYKYVNRFLPVYKVAFGRADGIRIYVETAQDRFAFALDNKRAAFDTFFSLFHTLGWLDVLGRGKHVLEALIMLLAIFTTSMGLYMFFTTKTKSPRGNITARARRTHRYTSLVVSLFTLLFTFSGGWHALAKLDPDNREKYFVDNRFDASVAAPDMNRIQAAAGDSETITNVGIVKIEDGLYWQVFHKKASQQGSKSTAATKQGSAKQPGNKLPAAGNDLMKSMQVPPPNTLYISQADYRVLKDGEKQYAQYIASQFSKRTTDRIIETRPVTKFEDEYGFVNKRLPVWKVGYKENSNERYYVETSGGQMAALVNDIDYYEGYSFALFHKHHFMDWGGKEVRDISTMFWAFMQVLMIAVGLWFWWKLRK